MGEEKSRKTRGDRREERSRRKGGDMEGGKKGNNKIPIWCLLQSLRRTENRK